MHDVKLGTGLVADDMLQQLRSCLVAGHLDVHSRNLAREIKHYCTRVRNTAVTYCKANVHEVLTCSHLQNMIPARLTVCSSG